MNHRFFKPALGGVLAILLAASPVLAEPAPETDVDPLKLDQSIQALKEEALDIKASQQNAENELLYPDSTRAIVYLSVPATALLVQSVAVSIDGGSTVKVTLDNDNTEPTEAIALQNRGLLTVMRANVPAGSHELLAEVTAHYKDSDAQKPPYVTQLSTHFTKDDQPLSLELVMGRDSDGRPNLVLRQWKAAK